MSEPRATPALEQIRSYWETHPLCSIELPYEPGTRAFFEAHNRLRDGEVERYSKRLWCFDGLAGKRVLDLGCGPGWLVQNYAAGKAKVVGVDLTYRALALTRARLEFAGLRSPVVQADLQALPFQNSSVDFISCAGVLHHIPSPEQGVSEIYRVLKPGAVAVLSLYYKNVVLRPYLWPLTRFLIQQLFKNVPGRRNLARSRTVADLVRTYDGDANPLGRAYDRAEARRLCRQFSVEKIEIHYFPVRFLRLSRVFGDWGQRLLDRLGGMMIFLVLKK